MGEHGPFDKFASAMNSENAQEADFAKLQGLQAVSTQRALPRSVCNSLHRRSCSDGGGKWFNDGGAKPLRLRYLAIKNFKAIRELELADLTDAIVVAGPNGCGKSSIFDALRLLKSAYGQYHQNEYGQWFSEFDINADHLEREAERILFDPAKGLSIQAELELSEGEVEHLSANAFVIYRSLRWSQLRRQRSALGEATTIDPKQKQIDGEIVDNEASKLATTLMNALSASSVHKASLTMKTGETPVIEGSPVLELMFSVYNSDELGVIEYQSPTRVFDREKIGNVNLKIQDASSKKAQHALYNTRNKYTGVKTEMAQSFVMELLAERAGLAIEEKNTLQATLDELFANFFPGKKFLGAVPTQEGGLDFPVLLENGRKHDINDLSSGEKEVLLGYLRLRNDVPKNSIILFDEPELHLNPRLARALPRFYEKHIGRANSNQIWLVTHSDSILQEAVRDPAYNVFHMRPAGQVEDGQNQMELVQAGEGIESAIVNLVGDLAAYSPRAKVVLLEGEDSEVDARIISHLFPSFADRVNLVSMGSKRNVSNAHLLLESASENGKLDARFYSIVDRDFGGDDLVEENRQFSWDRYHIENYLLEPEFIRKSLYEVTGGELDIDEQCILTQLKVAATATIPDLVRIKLQRTINAALINTISLNYDRNNQSAPEGFSQAIARSVVKLNDVSQGFSEAEISDLVEADTAELTQALEQGEWVKNFRGRNVLKRFVEAQNGALNYKQLQNLVLARMRESEYQPAGMREVIEKILEG